MFKRFGILFFIFVFLFWGGKTYAQSQFSATLTKMEKSLFGVDYSTQADDARLKRIEEVVYGKSSSTPVPQRVGKLSKDLAADLIGQEIKPKEDTFAEDGDSVKEEPSPKADSSVNYPAVDSLEKEVFSKQFKNLDINQRLSNLEQRVFKKNYNDDLSSRVDRLKAAVLPETNNYAANNDEEESTGAAADSSNVYEPEDILSQNSPPSRNSSGGNYFTPPKNYTPSYNSQNSVLDEYSPNTDINIPLAAMEKSVLKKAYPDDTVSNRLTRLEVKMFSSSFIDDDDQTRLDRVASAYQAKKSSKKYDNNKYTQHMSAAMQIGALLLMVLAAVL